MSVKNRSFQKNVPLKKPFVKQRSVLFQARSFEQNVGTPSNLVLSKQKSDDIKRLVLDHKKARQPTKR
ncbi:hypothetical protein CH380_07670 [Leptospira adleri]|uniref:Uncharacterized protein n=1 Tax=Leptospira adleri TaxID=2023186 RepID=A0A2M9YQP9_9LEPT|nr:hypothetical protein CH380_07670 [Leptospira adleri]